MKLSEELYFDCRSHVMKFEQAASNDVEKFLVGWERGMEKGETIFPLKSIKELIVRNFKVISNLGSLVSRAIWYLTITFP